MPVESKTCETDGLRLDSFVTEAFDSAYSRSFYKRLIDDGKVTVNGKVITKAGTKLAAGDLVEADIPAPVEDESFVAQDIPLDIVYEDSDLLVINKPQGMVVHPAAGHSDGTLVNALLAHCKDELSDINGAIAMGCGSYLFILLGGIANNGFHGLMGTIKEFSLPLSMSFRLFGALLSGALVTELVYYPMFLSFGLPVIVGVLFTLLHALIQAYVLTLLVSIFYGEVSEEKLDKVEKKKRKQQKKAEKLAAKNKNIEENNENINNTITSEVSK